MRPPARSAQKRRSTAGTPALRADDAAARAGFAPAAAVPWTWSAALAAALLGVYLLLAPHVSGNKDASEFALVLATGGVLHPTGYPFYTLLGHAFVTLLHRAGAGFPFAANAWAALGGGVAMFLFHRLALRLLPARGSLRRRDGFLLAAVPVAVLASNPVWMLECTEVEVHSWQMVWACGTALVFVGLLDALATRGAQLTRLPARMAAWGLLCGVGGAHHVTAVFLAGGMTLALAGALVRAGRWRAWVPLLWLAAGILPLASYAWVAWRAAHPGGSEIWPVLEPSLAGVIAHVTASTYRDYLGHWAPDVEQAAWLQSYVYPYLWPALVLLGFQTWNSRGARRLALGAWLAAALAQVVFIHRYGVSDPDAYFLPCLAVGLLALVPAGSGLLERLGRTRTGVAVSATVGALALTLLAVPGVRMVLERRQGLDLSDRYFHAGWTSIPYERAIVIWPVDAYYHLREYQVFHGEKPGLDVYNTANLFNDLPRQRFRRKYGFNPLALEEAATFSTSVSPVYAIGQQPSAAQARAFALVHECIAERAGIPVVAFDPPNPPRTLPARPDTASAPADAH